MDNGVDRTMFALTDKNGQTRIYLTEGSRRNGVTSRRLQLLADGNADQPAAALLASQTTRTERVPPDAATHTFPATFNGWQS